MLIGMYLIFVNVILPTVHVSEETMTYAMASVIVILGIIMMFGIKNMGEKLMDGLGAAIGFVFNTIFGAIGWLFNFLFNLVPRVYTRANLVFIGMGCNLLVSGLLSVLVTAAIVAIII